jgi:PAS domain S-box-containing protein
MIENSPIPALVTDPNLPDNPIIEVNHAFLTLTGYEREEVIGSNCRFLAGPGTEAWASAKLAAAVRERRPTLVELLNYRKDGTPFRNAVMAVPLFDDSGVIRYFLGSQTEIPDTQGAETTAAESAAFARARVETLTERQHDILVQMAEGKLNKQIAFDLGLSERTVKMHRAALFRALGVKTTAEAIRVAVEAGL